MSTTTEHPLPPGQRAFPWRPFGKAMYAGRTIPAYAPAELTIAGAVARPILLTWDELTDGLPTVDETTDLHCVMTWSAVGIRWQGVRFVDVHERLADLVQPAAHARWITAHGLDGYVTCLALEDALRSDVMLVNGRDGACLDIEHGGPIRLISPSQYGYKSAKHLCSLEYSTGYEGGPQPWMSHPRGRVAHEERSRYLPGWFYRRTWGALRETAWRAYDTRAAQASRRTS
ncbi:molybdopterin-dependent oxidoreductase [Luteipulveratus mongoliensis]|uniref:molybdopterin-dependent oxidoreductase n=1 Tax=Luteipulveratus mongoliensis TaxID=571913 RepID=UPI00069732FD|nr:molybdopterin-dependent oxidoreductase [Luteipulveratus mongoliensis]